VQNVSQESHPSRVRGLKHSQDTLSKEKETSHPSRVRGLKPIMMDGFHLSDMSHPSRVRGLKHLSQSMSAHLLPVAPLAGAWIETCKSAAAGE